MSVRPSPLLYASSSIQYTHDHSNSLVLDPPSILDFGEGREKKYKMISILFRCNNPILTNIDVILERCLLC